MKTQADEESSAVPLDEIMKHLYDAASSKSWRPSHQLATTPMPIGLTAGAHAPRIHSALNRARTKAFVKAVKPLRRLFRNQGAVNDSILEALYHLSEQAREMIDEITYLQKRVSVLEMQLRRRRMEETDADAE